MTGARSSGRVSKVDAGSSVEKKDVVGRVVEPLAPVTASSSGIAMLAQAKLSVGRVDDPAELEADEMAQKFSQWSDQGVGGVDVSEGSSSGDAMRSAETGTLETGGFEVGADVQSEISSRSGRGEPLADGQRAKFEKFFNKDLSAVRVHADSDAARLSGSLGADAFTVGSDVYFGAGRYQSGASDKLLAHELTHVVQQNSTVNRLPSFKKGWDNLFNGRERNQKKKAATRFKAERDEIRNREENEATHIGDDEFGASATFAEGGNEFSIPYEGLHHKGDDSSGSSAVMSQGDQTFDIPYEGLHHKGDDSSGSSAVMSQGDQTFDIPYEQQPSAPTYEVPISNETYQANKRRDSTTTPALQNRPSPKDGKKKKTGSGNDPDKYTDSIAGKRFGRQGKGLTTAEFERESKILSSGDEKLWKKKGYTKSLSDMQDYVARNTREIAKRKTNEGTELDPFKQKDVAPESLIHNAFKKWTNGGGLTIKDKVMMCYLSFEQKLGSEDDPPFRIGHFMSSENYDYKNTKKHTEGMWDKTVDTGRLSTIPVNILSAGEKKQALETAEIVKNVMDLVDQFQSLNKKVKPKKGEKEVKDDVGARELFSHGGRVNIKVPKLGGMHTDGTALTDAIGLTVGGEMRTGGDDSKLVYSRMGATHGTRFSWDGKESKEQGGMFYGGGASNWLTKGNKTWGLDLAIGGAGNLDYNGKVIKCDGSHGHLMINWTAPTKTTHGVLMVGVETTGLGAKSQDGYEHTWLSNEKTANLMSTAGGLKKEKNNSGASQSLGMHVVDLRDMDRSMKDLLDVARKAKEPLSER